MALRRVAGIVGSSRNALDTVAGATPAARATVRIVMNPKVATKRCSFPLTRPSRPGGDAQAQLRAPQVAQNSTAAFDRALALHQKTDREPIAIQARRRDAFLRSSEKRGGVIQAP
jgi:hypothetical protein